MGAGRREIIRRRLEGTLGGADGALVLAQGLLGSVSFRLGRGEGRAMLVDRLRLCGGGGDGVLALGSSFLRGAGCAAGGGLYLRRRLRGLPGDGGRRPDGPFGGS